VCIIQMMVAINW